MATFKAGQKVKRVRDPLGGADSAADTTMPIGATGTVLGGAIGSMIGVQPDSGAMEWYCDPASLEPLTDPGADAFLERIRKLKPYDEPKVEPRVLVNK
jgi:hypothetical protein